MKILKKKQSVKLLRFPPEDNRKGSVLVLVLWSLCLLTVFAVNLSHGARQRIIMVGRLEQRNKLHFIADAGIRRSILELKKMEEGSAFTALKDYWSSNRGIFRKIRVSDEGKFTISYEYLNTETGKRQIRYGMVDEERKININHTKPKVIERLLKIVGLDGMEAQNLSASIVDWRDNDSELSIPLGSAEDRYYRGLRDPYEAKDADFEVLDELFLVKGMNAEIFDKIKDYVTIYGEGKININTASKEVLLSLGLQESVVNKILSFRYGEDSVEATLDDYVFTSPGAITADLSQMYSLSASQVANLSNLISEGKITTKSDNFMIRSTAMLNKNKASSEIICVFGKSFEGSEKKNSNKNGKIKYWREGF